MNDQERTKSIRERLESVFNTANIDDNGCAEVNFLAMHNDMHWLIGRVQELEVSVESLSEESRLNFEAAYQRGKDNQRYKRALEKIANNKGMNFNYESGHVMNLWEIAHQALEGESE